MKDKAASRVTRKPTFKGINSPKNLHKGFRVHGVSKYLVRGLINKKSPRNND